MRICPVGFRERLFCFAFLLSFYVVVLAADSDRITCMPAFVSLPEPTKEWSVKQQIAGQPESVGAVGSRHIGDKRV